MAAEREEKDAVTFTSIYEEVTPEFYEYLLSIREDIFARWLARLILKEHETNSAAPLTSQKRCHQHQKTRR